MRTNAPVSPVSNEELMLQTHAMVKTLYRAYWWSAIFGWIKFIIFIMIPLGLYWWIAPQIPIFQDKIFQTIQEYRQTVALNTTGSNQQLAQWCKMYCSVK